MNKMNMAEYKSEKNNDTMVKVDETKNGKKN